MAVTTVRSASVPSKSTHTSDPILQPFLQDTFDPAAYLNSTLPTLSTTSRVTAANYVQLPDLISQTQTLLNQLNAHTTRLSNVLTQLTDEIVRSGGRLSYEVEVLKGEVIGLGEVFDGSLKDDITLFLPAATVDGSEDKDAGELKGETTTDSSTVSEPEDLQRLRILTLVRSRLANVAQTFDKAMSWPLAPSDLQQSQSNPLISIAAPDPSDSASEDKGKQAADTMRKEILALIGDGRDVEGLEAAAERVRDLRELVGVWKGTMEEKARTRFVEGLERTVEDVTRRSDSSAGTKRGPAGNSARPMDYRYGGVGGTGGVEGGYGFLSNLRNLSKDVYLE